MVLCPFIYVYTCSDSPQLKPQPTEVASTHWVSLRALLSSSLRTQEYVDVSDRFTRQGGYLTRMACRSIIGWMQFPAIRLVPTESLHCNSVPGFIPETEDFPDSLSLFQRLKKWSMDNKSTSPHNSNNNNRSLLLWGLTLGILADFLDMLPPHTAVSLWTYPNFTTLDLRLIVTILTYQLRKRNMLQVKSGDRGNQTAVDSQTAALPVVRRTGLDYDQNAVGTGKFGRQLDWRSSEHQEREFYAVGVLLKGYYNRLRVAIMVFLAWRAVAGGVTAYFVWKLLRYQLHRVVK